MPNQKNKLYFSRKTINLCRNRVYNYYSCFHLYTHQYLPPFYTETPDSRAPPLFVSASLGAPLA